MPDRNRKEPSLKLFALTSAIVFLFVVLPLNAATVTLKSGETVEGEIVSDTNGVVQISVPNPARTIFSLRSLQRGDIQEIQYANAEQRAYEEVQRYRLTVTNSPVAYYDRIIRDVFRKFLTDFPESNHNPAVSELIAQWITERDKVAGGAVKWGNRWYEGAAVKIVPNQIKATQLIEEGDRQLWYNRYEAALAKYREALASGPLVADILEQISSKVNTTGERWKAAVSTQESSSGQLQNINVLLQQFSSDLTQARAESQRMEAEEASRPAIAPDQPVVSTNAPVAVAEAPVPQSIGSWCRQNWIWLSIGGLVVVYFVCRRLES